MCKNFIFFYDESEHSRKINYSTITSAGYYDNFVVSIVGCSNEYYRQLEKRYMIFEEKYGDRKSNGELKSTTIKPKQLINGFASLNKQNVQFLNDYFDLFTDDVFIYFSVFSKVEYLILQLFKHYQSNRLINTESLKYSIVKAIIMYQPEDIMNGIYNQTSNLPVLLKNFLFERIKLNDENPVLKSRETEAFKQALVLLNEVSADFKIDWEYQIAFDGFNSYLDENQIHDYKLVLDKEGDDSPTLNAARKQGLVNVSEVDSTLEFGVRMADMLTGILTKMLKSIHRNLRYSSMSDQLTKKLLDVEWFRLSSEHLILYKKFHHIISQLNNSWYKSFSGNYTDDLLSLITFLGFIAQFDSVEEILVNLESLPERLNSSIVVRLMQHFEQMQSDSLIKSGSKLKKAISEKSSADNNSSATLLFISEIPNIYNVLSVSINDDNEPVVSIKEDGIILDFLLPKQLAEWVIECISFINMGIELFPDKVMFMKHEDNYFVDFIIQ
ncbi:hypothetical protein [Enterococcus durans]|uniref:hypothetical protein n=1 Tax=Enterococcus durans TaxID=53345 RepID=UPI00189CB39B|nr:hypothetical protein [Enterococcus durans]MDB1684411.1 hypothetical protein [Enterococcus durans]